MPIFDYCCGDCSERFEARVTSARARPAGPRCGARRARRLPAAPAVRGTSRNAPMLPTKGKPARGCGLIERPPRATSDRK
jgi:putative FmdB family regulatory protein